MTNVGCETEVLQFGRRYGWTCLCGSVSGVRYDAWSDAESSAGEHEDAWRRRAIRGGLHHP